MNLEKKIFFGSAIFFLNVSFGFQEYGIPSRYYCATFLDKIIFCVIVKNI